MSEQQGDVHIFQTLDDGEITVINGVTTMVPGLGNAAYLSLFGGNELDDGSDDNPNEYWGNYISHSHDQNYRSETQNLLIGLPAVSANLKPIEDAVNRDLRWMISSGVATDINVTVTMPGLNRISIVVDIGGDESANLKYEVNWLASI